jgi:thiol-disulfide isomerase/thioredoxin
MLRTLAPLCLVLLLVSSLSFAEETAKKAPGFSLRDVNSSQVILDSLLGKGPIVVDFWATWCKPCVSGLDYLKELYKELKDRGLVVVAMNEDDPKNISKVKPFAFAHRWEFLVVLDPNKAAKRAYQVSAFPTTFVLDAQGNIVNKHVGYTPGEESLLKKEIESLLPPVQARPDTCIQKQGPQRDSE